jgi:hypothetical protein
MAKFGGQNMDPKFSRRGWFRGLFAAMLAQWAMPAAGAGPAPAAGGAGASLSPGATYVAGQTTTVVYDAAIPLTSVTDPLGSVATYVYDAAGRII